MFYEGEEDNTFRILILSFLIGFIGFIIIVGILNIESCKNEKYHTKIMQYSDNTFAIYECINICKLDSLTFSKETAIQRAHELEKYKGGIEIKS